jgi:cytohesin
MTKAEWLKNCRGVDQGRDLPRDYLERIYDDVMPERDQDGHARPPSAVSQARATSPSRAAASRRGRSAGSSSATAVCTITRRTGDKEPLGIIPLENVDVRESKKKKYCFELWQADNNTMKAAKIAADGSVQRGHHDSYALAAATAEEMREWIDAIERCVCQNPFQRLIDRRLAAVATTDSAAAHQRHGGDQRQRRRRRRQRAQRQRLAHRRARARGQHSRLAAGRL